MADELRHRPTVFDLMVLVAASAAGAWGCAAYGAGFPLPIIARPGLPLAPLLLSIPVAMALTWATVAVPARTFRDRLRRPSQELGTALCAAAAVASLGVVVRWSLRAWLVPYADGSPWVYGARVLFECGAWCGMGVLVALVLLTLEGRSRRPVGWLEWARLALATYWVAAFLIFSVL